MLEGPKQKRPRLRPPPEEDNSDLHIYATIFTREAERDLNWSRPRVDLRTVTGEINELYERLLKKDFTYRDLNSFKMLWLALVALTTPIPRADPEQPLDEYTEIRYRIRTEGAALAARREVLLGRWKFAYERVFLGEWVELLIDPVVILSRLIGGTRKRNVRLPHALPKITTDIWRYAEFVLRDSSIIATLREPPRLLEHRDPSDRTEGEGTISIKDRMSIFLNGMLVYTWVGGRIQWLSMLHALNIVSEKGTPEQQEAVTVVRSYEKLNRIWLKQIGL